MKDVYILKRNISDFDWDDSYTTDLFMSYDRELLEELARILTKQHQNSEHNFNYWVVKAPALIDNFETFETHKDELLDGWEDTYE